VQPAARHHVLERAHVEEDLQVLESAADAGGRELVRRAADHGLLPDPDPAFLRPIDAAQQVEQRGLAGAVHSIIGPNGAGLDLEVERLERAHAAEALTEVFGAQQQAPSPASGPARAA
jgi:hypothetical protein